MDAKLTNLLKNANTKLMCYVESPFQLIQAYELSKISKNKMKIYVRTNGKKNNDEQLGRLILLFRLQNVELIKISLGTKGLLKHLRTVIMMFRFDIIVIGDPKSFLNKIVMLIPYRFCKSKLLYLDDGTSTLTDDNTNKRFLRFTIFSNVVGNYIHNNFFNLKEIISSNCDVKETKNIIIGSPLVDSGAISIEKYRMNIRSMLDQIDNSYEVIYIAHRNESDEIIRNVLSGLEISSYRLMYPIELISYELKIVLTTLHSVISTAVFSMKIIYPSCKVFLYRDCDNKLKLKDRCVEDRIYSYFKSSSTGTLIFHDSL